MNNIANDFYRIVDKNGRVQVTGTFDQCFDELAELVSKCPSFGWTMEHVKDGEVLREQATTQKEPEAS